MSCEAGEPTGLRCSWPLAAPRPIKEITPSGTLLLRSELEACFTMVNGILGAGVLGYPFAFRRYAGLHGLDRVQGGILCTRRSMAALYALKSPRAG